MLLRMLFWDAVWDAVWGAVGGASDGAGARLTGCCLGRSSGGAVGGAGVQSLLSGVYAGVILFVYIGCPFLYRRMCVSSPVGIKGIYHCLKHILSRALPFRPNMGGQADFRWK